jgi:hypothetical protein
MELYPDGFLSKDIDRHVAECLEDFPRHAGLIDRANRVAMDFLRKPRSIPDENADLLTTLLFGRAVQDFEAAIFLAQHGFRAQSRSMVRSTFEAALYCQASSREISLLKGMSPQIKKGTGTALPFIDGLIGGHQRFRLATAKELRDMQELPSDHSEALSEVIDDLGPASSYKDIDIKGLAADLGFSDLYTVIYRSLSQDSHPSVTSLNHHVNLTPESKITGFHFGPDYEQFEETAAFAICSLLLAMEAFTIRCGSPEESEEVKSLTEAYRDLMSDVT